MARERDCVKVSSSEGLENVGKVARLYYDEKEGNARHSGEGCTLNFRVSEGQRSLVLHAISARSRNHSTSGEAIEVSAEIARERAFGITLLGHSVRGRNRRSCTRSDLQ